MIGFKEVNLGILLDQVGEDQAKSLLESVEEVVSEARRKEESIVEIKKTIERADANAEENESRIIQRVVACTPFQ